MKERILTGWNFQRVLFVTVGVLALIPAVMDGQWAGWVAGIYFTAMGLFGFGCAAGDCAYKGRR